MATPESFVEARDEPSHHVIFENEYIRAIRVLIKHGANPTLWHRHNLDSFYIHLENAQLLNACVGKDPGTLDLKFGGCAYGNHAENPFVHQISVLSTSGWRCIDGELLSTPKVVAERPLVAENHSLALEKGRVRMYTVDIPPQTRCKPVTYGFHGLFFSSVETSQLQVTKTDANTDATNVSVSTQMKYEVGDCFEIHPTTIVTYFNHGDAPVSAHIVEITA
eukprot:m.872544 g.872544  ORF g.872544 m.872544 type:complete len:221 (+) comp23571_c0_seq10:101-763(+)